jgi:hypothetical protein
MFDTVMGAVKRVQAMLDPEEKLVETGPGNVPERVPERVPELKTELPGNGTESGSVPVTGNPFNGGGKKRKRTRRSRKRKLTRNRRRNVRSTRRKLSKRSK